jgi:hypothetical protein
MFRSPDSNHAYRAVAAGLAGAAVLSVGPIAQRSVNLPSRDVSARTAAAAVNRDPLAFAAALSAERIPAGFVLIGVTERSHDSAADAQYTKAPVSLSRAVELFLVTHPGFTLVDDSAWAFVLRPSERSLCDVPLDRALRTPPISGSALEAFWRLASLVNPAAIPKAPPSIVCGAGDCARREEGSRTAVVLPGGDMTLQEGLSQVAGQAGVVWLLHEVVSPQTGQSSCGFGYFDGGSRVTTSYVLARSSGPR